jgi:hypothetical protein
MDHEEIAPHAGTLIDMIAYATYHMPVARQRVQYIDDLLIMLGRIGYGDTPAQRMRWSLPWREECMVCMEDVRVEDGGMELLTCCTTSLAGPFHMVCSACWPKLRHSCPLCKKRVEAFSSADLPGFIEYMRLS